ncbi:hypothetical protein AB0C13_20350 [Streptomyces sp. NPDC049099]|uniref:hypothetical protein n=1 Tax=Streptomyces sp. NPDC049099 TaxID=3155768 RepID=UPI0034313CEB
MRTGARDALLPPEAGQALHDPGVSAPVCPGVCVNGVRAGSAGTGTRPGLTRRASASAVPDDPWLPQVRARTPTAARRTVGGPRGQPYAGGVGAQAGPVRRPTGPA